jgi:type IV pilus assembly protein PilN
VILINLLPHREAKRQERKRAFFAGLVFAVIVGAGIVASWYSVLEGLIHIQGERNQFLQSEIVRLDNQIKDIAALRSEIDALKARQKAVEDLEADRNMPVYLLNELVKQTPEGVYLTSVKQNGQTVAITGMAQTNERISEFLRNTAYNSPWLEKPLLQGIRAVQAGAPGAKDSRRMFDFALSVTLKRPPAPGAAASGASAPAKPAASVAATPAKS